MGISRLIGDVIWLYQIVLIVRVALTWIPHNPYHPTVAFLNKITNPVLEPVRRVIPSIGGIDFSPILVIIGLNFIGGAFR